MTAMLETRIVARSPESQVSLEQALRTLRALRQRYETARNGNANVCFLSIQVALAYTDMSWLSAAIEALEKVIVAGAAEAGPATRYPLRRSSDDSFASVQRGR
jgi:hypothetical protein